METKTCSKCNLIKDKSFFYKKDQNSGRLSNLCKECEKLRQRKNKVYHVPIDLYNEIWKDIPGYEGLYQVSSLGRVKGLKRTIYNSLKGDYLLEERLLKSGYNKNGYESYVLSNSKSKKRMNIHRLVALAFIPNPDDKPCVNHINGIKSDSSIGNLEWCTYSENTKHAFKTGLMSMTKGEECSWSKLTEDDVRYIRENKGIISYSKLSKKYKISTTTISKIINRKSWNHI